MRGTLRRPLIIAVLLGTTAFGQVPSTSVDAIFRDFATDQSPGCAVAAIRGDAPLVVKAYGMADLEHDIRLTPQSVFGLASVSKQFTALSVLLLERDGKLRLEDRVRTYIPELPDYAATITISQLLHHTSGLRDYVRLSVLAGNSVALVTEHVVLNMLARQARLNFEPGAAFEYSNSGYVLLGLIVQRVTARSLGEFANERIFTRLGMSNTRFRPGHAALIAGRVIGYSRENGTWRIVNSLLDVVGDGGVYSTVEDMLRWATAFERPEFAPLLARMQTPGILTDGRTVANGYGMGLRQVTYRGLQVVFHDGVGGGFQTRFMRVPAEKLTIVLLCNTGEDGTADVPRLVRTMVELYAPAGMTPAPAVSTDAPPPDPARFPIPRELAQAAAGAYYSAELDATYRFVAGSDGLSVEVGNTAPRVLNVIGSDRLGFSNREITLVRNGTGVVTGFTLNTGSIRNVVFTKR